MAFAVAVDIGGTFTDLVAYDHDSHRVAYAKSPTTYGNFVEGILDCFNKVQLAPDQASFVNHGTTLVINSLIQRKGAKAALVTTTGFRDVLEIARGNRPDPFDLHYRRDEPLIPRPLRFEVTERIGSQGEIVTPLDTAALTALAGKIKVAWHRGGRDLLHELLRQSRARGTGRRGAAHAPAGRLHHQLPPNSRANGTNTSAHRRSPPTPMSDRRSRPISGVLRATSPRRAFPARFI